MEVIVSFYFWIFVFLYFESIQLSGYFWWRPLFWRSKEMASLISPLWSPKQQISDSWLFLLFGLNCKHTTMTIAHRWYHDFVGWSAKNQVVPNPKILSLHIFLHWEWLFWLKTKMPDEGLFKWCFYYVLFLFGLEMVMSVKLIIPMRICFLSFFLDSMFPKYVISTDSAYTERYMGLPVPEGNWKGFTESSLIGKAEYIQDNR